MPKFKLTPEQFDRLHKVLSGKEVHISVDYNGMTLSNTVDPIGIHVRLFALPEVD
jgi:hypothetical protein